jgi:ATP-dependent helicase IRC3
MSIRPYQQDGLDAIERQYRAGIHRQLVVMPTGTGKTVVFSQLPTVLKHLGLSGQVLVLAHRKELLSQAADKIQHWNRGLSIGVERAEEVSDPHADIVIASVPTLGRAGSARIKKFDPSKFAAVVIDEAHHSVAPTYQNVLDHFGFPLLPSNAQSGRSLLLGVTATPQRGDSAPLSTVFQESVFTYPLRTAIEGGWLVDLRAYRVRTDSDISHVRTTARDFNAGELADAINTEARNQAIVKAWLANSEGRVSLAFCQGIQHARDLAAMFQHYGVVASAVSDGDKTRDDKIDKFRRGEITVLTNFGILTEGFDAPIVGCILMARPTKSTLLYTQMVGRGTRLADGVDNLLKVPASESTKRDCLILDFVDNCGRHKLATSNMLFDLPETLDLEGDSLIAAKKKLEQRPEVDYSSLRNLGEIETYLDSVDLFWDTSVPPELECTALRWRCVNAGHYVLSYDNRKEPTKGVHVQLKQTQIGDWQAYSLDNRPLLKSAVPFAEAIRRVEAALQAQNRAAYNVLNRKASWNSASATENQMRYVAKEWRKRNATPIPLKWTKGAAAEFLNRCWNHAA